jgi:non-ribosomal peptide synthase protein (TIGR01720 family)
VDPNNPQKLLPVGAIGELLVEGPIVGRGYLNNQSQTNLVFISSPSWRSTFPGDTPYKFYRTGDLVRYSEGKVHFVGRKDFQTKIRGQRLELGEVIQHLRSVYPLEEDIVVDIIKPENGNPKLVAFICSNHCNMASQLDSFLLPPSDDFRNVAQKAEYQLSARIPDFMIPSIFLPLGSIPRTPQEKIDRKMLREIALALSETDIERYNHFDISKLQPSNEVEDLIQTTWAKVLNKEKPSVGINESFFRLGGDSITAMQVSSKLSSAGLAVTVAEIFRQKTIAKISAVVKKAAPNSISNDVEGVPFQLSPIQKFFFQVSPDGCNHFNQDFFLSVEKSVTSDAMRDALQHIVERHPMLRARFVREKSGHWTQVVKSFSSNVYHYQEYFVPSMREADSIMATLHQSLDIKQGPIFSAAVFNVQKDKFLFLAAHHLVVDLVSWRTILDDLELLLRMDSIPDATSVSFQTWCKLQEDYVTARLLPESAHEGIRPTVPADDYWGVAGHDNTFSDVVELGFSLDAQTTSVLFQEANQAFQTQPVELLQAGILHAFAQVFKDRPTPALWNEGHGREPWNSQIDISRTVGWYTTLWPLQLDISSHDLVEMIQQTKDQRRSIPGNGWGFFTASMLADKSIKNCEVLFNYVGRYQQLEAFDALFRPVTRSGAAELAGVDRSMSRFAIIEISVFHKDDCIYFVFSCNKYAIDRRPISTWVTACERSLRSIAEQLPRLSRGFTLSDFSLIPFTYESLNHFQNKTLPECGLSGADIEDIYPCSPIQRGMLLSQAKSERKLYVHFVIWKIRSNRLPLTLEKITQAWRTIVTAHSVRQECGRLELLGSSPAQSTES